MNSSKKLSLLPILLALILSSCGGGGGVRLLDEGVVREDAAGGLGAHLLVRGLGHAHPRLVVDAVGEFLEHLGDRDPLADEVADALATVQSAAVGARLAPTGCAAAAVPAALVGLDLRLEGGDLGLGGRELLLERALRGNLRLERRLRSRLGLVGAVRVVLVEDALHRERGRLEAVRLARVHGELALHAYA